MNRLDLLEQRINAFDLGAVWSFTLDNGKTFTTKTPPLDYIVQNGTQTPQGKIVAFQMPNENMDELSCSLYEAVQEEIETGAFREIIKNIGNMGD